MRILRNGTYDNIFKMAFPVSILPEEQQGMQGEGMYPITDPEIAETNVMPGVSNKKRDIKALVGQISLPRIIYPTPRNLIEIEGRQYYLVDVSEPQVKKNPTGTIYLMDIQTGQPVKLPFTQYADRIMSLKKEQVRSSLEEINARITKWNERIDKIKQVESPTTWPLQLAWAVEVVDDRIAELDRMDQALVQSLDAATAFSPSYSASIDRLKGELAAGRITSRQDIIDTALYIHNEEPDAIPVLLESPTMPDDVKSLIRQLLGMQSDAAAQKKIEEEQKQEDRQGRIDTETDFGVMQPGQQPLVQVKEEDVEEKAKKARLPTPDQYFSPKGRVKQIRAKLIGIRRDKTELTGIRNALDGMRAFIGSLAKGERASEVLSAPGRGEEIKRQVTQFVHEAKAFMRRYSTDVFVRDEAGAYSVNPKLFGTTGGKGNSEVAVVINQIVSIVSSSLKSMASPTPEPGPAPIEIGDIEEDGEEFSYLPQDVP